MAVPKLPLQLLGLSSAYHQWWWRRAIRQRPVLSEWNYEHNAIFIHIPKTAGTSVRAKLGVPSVFDTHAPSEIYRKSDPAFYQRAYKFCFVRNPWDRFASSFHFLKSGTGWKLQEDWARAHIGDQTFEEFTLRLRDPLHRAAVMAERFFWPQTLWLGGVGRTDGTDEIFRFEGLEESLALLAARLGLGPQATTPHLRQVERPAYRALYSDNTVEIVRKLYRRDIEALGYTF